jgi:hypothetical protein
MTVTKITKPVVYKGHLITVNKLPDDRYVFMISRTVTVDLTGIAPDLPSAFEQARQMIDDLEDKHE